MHILKKSITFAKENNDYYEKKHMKIKELLIFWLIITALFFSYNATSLFIGEYIELKSKVIHITKTKDKYDKRTFTLRNEYGLFKITEETFYKHFNKNYDDIKCGDSVTSKNVYSNWYHWASNYKTKSNITKLYNSRYVTKNMNAYAVATFFAWVFLISVGFFLFSIVHFVCCLYHVLSNKVSLF